MPEETATRKPTYRKMTLDAIQELKDRGGSTVAAIRKYLTNNYGIPMDKSKFHLKRYLGSAVQSGELVQISKGSGMRFKLGKKSKPKPKPKPKKMVKKAATSQEKASPKSTDAVKSKKKPLKKSVKEAADKGKAPTTKQAKEAVEKIKNTATKSKASKDRGKKAVLKRASLIGGIVAPKMKKKTKKSNKKAATEAA